MRYILLLTLNILSFFSTKTIAQTFSLVKDINNTPKPANWRSSNFLQVNQKWFFVSETVEEGIELWVSDGTAVGTHIVKDINKGANGSHPSRLIKVGNQIFFWARDNSTADYQLWKSDGTEIGTTMVKNFGFSFGITLRNESADFNGNYYFVFDDALHGEELWKSDGTENGTILVKDIVPGPNASYPFDLTSYNGMLYFLTRNGLWRTDGTSTGTLQLTNQLPYYTSLNDQMPVLNGNLYYFTYDNGTSLWKSNGNTGGASLVKDIPKTGLSYGNVSEFIVQDNQFYFVIKETETTYTLWKSDGTTSGTAALKSFTQINSENPITGLTIVNNTLYFTASTPAMGNELWKTNGTIAGTVIVKDIKLGAESGAPKELVNIDNQLLFYTNNGDSGTQLWRSDGSEAGTVVVKNNTPTGNHSMPYYYSRTSSNILLFSSNTSNGQEEIWKSDGTLGGTTAIINPRPGTESAFKVGYEFFNFSNKILLFTANDGASGFGLWKTDGTALGTSLVKSSSSPSHVLDGIHQYIEMNGFAYMGTGLFGQAGLWKTDGTGNGTQLVKSMTLKSPFTKIDETLFFSGLSNEGWELWKSDGTETGTRLVKDIYSQQYMSSSPDYLTKVGNTLFFAAKDSVNSINLWKSDGTEAGTVRVKKIKQIQSDSITGIRELQPTEFAAVNNMLFFTADDGIHGIELWKSDGTDAGTTMVKNIYEKKDYDPIYIHPKHLTNVNGKLFFVATDTTNGTTLWKSDGTETGTVMVKDIRSDNYYDYFHISNLIAVDDILYFQANDQIHGPEIWRSDGTSTGTYMIKNINPLNVPQQSPVLMTSINGLLYFSANDGIHGEELWKTNGTESGTVMIQNIGPTGGSRPEAVTLVGNKIFLTAFTNQYGGELWVAQSEVITNIREEDISIAYKTYPNPVTNTVTVFTSTNQGNGYWQLINLSGQLIQSGVLKAGEKTFSINMQQVAKGMYFLKIQPEKSKHTITKLIKQ